MDRQWRRGQTAGERRLEAMGVWNRRAQIPDGY
jgi:hypothetical protein